jgi:hypothetical protein
VKRLLAAVVFFAALCTIQDGELRPPPRYIKFPSEVCEAPRIDLHNFVHFWIGDRADLRVRMSMPANKRLLALFADVVARAHQHHYTFQAPQLLQTRPALEPMLGRTIPYVLAMTYVGPRKTIVNSWGANRMNDQELRTLLAHELGHVIDTQNERMGHPIFELMRPDEDDELVADSIAADLYGTGAVLVLRAIQNSDVP